MDRLVPYARNSRTHSAEQIAKIAASITEFGFTNPILVDGKSGIVAGHGRLAAAKKLGMAEVPVIELTHLTEAQKRAYVIADNKLALDAGWDEMLLREEMIALEDVEFDLSLTGFSDEELDRLMATEETEQADSAGTVRDEQRHLLMIECDNERELEKLFEEMQRRGLNCKVLS